MATRPLTRCESLSPRSRMHAVLEAVLDPHLADAAAHLVGVGARALGEFRQFAAEFDHIAIAVFPIVEEGEIVANGVERAQGGLRWWTEA